ncbi:cob(I)yrinic acid a,c-diamide adenosyltransferase [bacterium]|nr:cob(I)yrinic acid a,c-diamide adenosyltransferase [bacterium]
MKIYTRTGDKGETSLLRGGRVPKHHPRVEAYGSLDELNSWIGYVRSINTDDAVEAVLADMQPKLHVACSDTAASLSKSEEGAKIPRVREGWDTELEADIDRMEQDLSPLTNFILPGGTATGAALHVARTICRRAERAMTELQEIEGDLNPEAIRFVNRLADHLFTLARWANHRAGREEKPWIGEEHVQG